MDTNMLNPNATQSALNLYNPIVPTLLNQLDGLAHLLQKLQTHLELHQIPADAILYFRLYPDMFDFTRQIQICSDFAKNIAKLTSIEVPKFADEEKTLDELKLRVQKTKDFLNSLSKDDFQQSKHKLIEVRVPNYSADFLGEVYVHQFLLPNFYFHKSMAYAILRHNGVMIGKGDFFKIGI